MVVSSLTRHRVVGHEIVEQFNYSNVVEKRQESRFRGMRRNRSWVVFLWWLRVVVVLHELLQLALLALVVGA